MRTCVSFVHQCLVVTTLGSALAFGCGGEEAKKPGSDAAGSNGAGSGNTSNGGSSSGGSTGTTGGDGSGGTTSGGAGMTGGSGGDGGTTPTRGGSAGDAGTPGTGGDAGSSTGGSAGNAGSAGSAGSGGTPSAGCRTGATPMSGRFMIDVSGTMREYIVKLPSGYDSTRPYRLIFAFHGGMYDAQSVHDGGPPGSGPYYGIEAEAGGSTIFVAPQALTGSWTNQDGRDIAYVNAMVARFRAELCVDESRIFATGFSFGGQMTLAIGCTGDGVFRAIAPMSASIRGTCDGDRPIAYWSSHGTNDTTITPGSGMTARDEFIEKNGCTTTSVPGDREGCVNYEGCDGGAPVTWCTFTGVHEPAPYAGEAIWDFFAQF
jgi:polyhydroxybutyrate depolymerase